MQSLTSGKPPPTAPSTTRTASGSGIPTTPFRHILKLSGGIPFKYSIMVSGNFQIDQTPGIGLFLAAPYFAASHVFTTANAGRQIVTSDGGGGLTVKLAPAEHDFRRLLQDLRPSRGEDDHDWPQSLHRLGRVRQPHQHAERCRGHREFSGRNRLGEPPSSAVVTSGSAFRTGFRGSRGSRFYGSRF